MSRREPNGLKQLKTPGARLRYVRLARGLSQITVGEACGVSRSAVSMWETGETTATDANLEQAATRLQVPLEWLRAGSGPTPDITSVPRGRRQLLDLEAARDILQSRETAPPSKIIEV